MKIREWCPHCEEVTKCKTRVSTLRMRRTGRNIQTTQQGTFSYYTCTKCENGFEK